MNMNSIIALAIERSKDNSNVSRGSWCFFVDLGNNFGVKFYRTARERDWAHIAQACAWEVNAAPWAGETFEITRPESIEGSYNHAFDSIIFGYVTETVQHLYIDNQEDWQELRNRLRGAGFDTRDSNQTINTGMRRDGVAVQFDFDPEYALRNLVPSELEP